MSVPRTQHLYKSLSSLPHRPCRSTTPRAPAGPGTRQWLAMSRCIDRKVRIRKLYYRGFYYQHNSTSSSDFTLCKWGVITDLGALPLHRPHASRNTGDGRGMLGEKRNVCPPGFVLRFVRVTVSIRWPGVRTRDRGSPRRRASRLPGRRDRGARASDRP